MIGAAASPPPPSAAAASFAPPFFPLSGGGGAAASSSAAAAAEPLVFELQRAQLALGGLVAGDELLLRRHRVVAVERALGGELLEGVRRRRLGGLALAGRLVAVAEGDGDLDAPLEEARLQQRHAPLETERAPRERLDRAARALGAHQRAAHLVDAHRAVEDEPVQVGVGRARAHRRDEPLEQRAHRRRRRRVVDARVARLLQRERARDRAVLRLDAEPDRLGAGEREAAVGGRRQDRVVAAAQRRLVLADRVEHRARLDRALLHHLERQLQPVLLQQLEQQRLELLLLLRRLPPRRRELDPLELGLEGRLGVEGGHRVGRGGWSAGGSCAARGRVARNSNGLAHREGAPLR